MSEDGHAARAYEAKLGALVSVGRPNRRKDVIVFGKGRFVPAAEIGEGLNHLVRLRINDVQHIRIVVGGIDEVVSWIEPQFVSRNIGGTAPAPRPTGCSCRLSRPSQLLLLSG